MYTQGKENPKPKRPKVFLSLWMAASPDRMKPFREAGLAPRREILIGFS